MWKPDEPKWKSTVRQIGWRQSLAIIVWILSIPLTVLGISIPLAMMLVVTGGEMTTSQESKEHSELSSR
jgi:hypothetical protein